MRLTVHSQVLEVVAAVQERDPEELMAQVFENSCRFFSWTPSPEEAGGEGGAVH